MPYDFAEEIDLNIIINYYQTYRVVWNQEPKLTNSFTQQLMWYC